MATTRAVLRRRVGRLIGDLVVATCSATGSTTTITDTTNLNVPDGTLKQRLAYVVSAAQPTIVGQTRRVTNNVASTGTATVGVAFAATTTAGDVVELWNERGVGVTPEEVHDALDRAIEAVGDAALTGVLDTAATFSATAPTVAIPAGWAFFAGAEWQDSEGNWRPIPHADIRLDPVGRTAELRNRGRWLADVRQVRLRGYTAAGALLTDAATTNVDSEWLTHQAAADVLFAAAHRAHVPAEILAKYGELQKKADAVRSKTRIRSVGKFYRLP